MTTEPDGNGVVLVVDDDASTRALVEAILRRAGYRVVVACDGDEGSRAAREHRPGVVLMDWEMPRMNGLDAARRILASAGDDPPFVVFLTVRSGLEATLRAFGAGADEFLTKPVHPEELIARVRGGLRVTALRRELLAANRRLHELADDVTAANGRLRQLATTDGLTGLLNRRAAMERLRDVLGGAQRDGEGGRACCALVDLDEFKALNDTHGHQAGDAALRRVASEAEAAVGQEGFAARIGGDEFLLAMRGVAPAEAERRVLEMRSRVAAGGGEVKVRISVGLAFWRPGMGVADLMAAADEAMYRDKANRRGLEQAA